MEIFPESTIMKIPINKASNHFAIFLICLSLLLAGGCTLPENRAARTSEDTAPSHEDTCAPERIILNLTENPSTSQAVTWRTCSMVEEPKAQIALATDSSAFEEDVQTIHAVSQKVSLGREGIVYQYSVVFQSLEPDTIYAYRVGTGDNWSEWNQFRTAGDNQHPFTFVYLGDPQVDIKSMCSRIFRAAFKKAPNADFWLFVGDLVDNGDNDEEWAELFDALGWIPGTTPMLLLPGNHEYPDRRNLQGKTYAVSPLWRPQFTLPENGPPGLEETVYFVDYQRVRFVMLNGNEKLEEQAAWLDRILSENPQPWTIAGIHQPIYETARYRDDSKRQNSLLPIFDKYSVDLVLQGHDHTYCRTYKIKNGVRTGENEKGTVYVISVSGPKSYPVTTRYQGLMAKMEKGRQLFQVIHMDHDRLFYQSFDARGEVFDSFTLKKT